MDDIIERLANLEQHLSTHDAETVHLAMIEIGALRISKEYWQQTAIEATNEKIMVMIDRDRLRKKVNGDG